jgi:hypothetical protein
VIKNILENKRILGVFLVGFAFLLSLITGCKQSSDDIDPNKVEFEVNMEFFEDLTSTQFPDIKERAKLAIKKYKNKTIDPDPILLYSTLLQPIGREDVHLLLSVFDEDEDLLGFVVREEIQGPDGIVEILEEKYPVYFNCPFLLVVSYCEFSIVRRETGQKKDEKKWEEFLSTDFSELKKRENEINEILNISPSPGEPFSETQEKWRMIDEIKRQWQESLPLIYISIPEPNHKTVWIRVYDNAGNKSNFVKLIDQTRQNN